MTCLRISAIPIMICHQFPEEIDDLLGHQPNSYYMQPLREFVKGFWTFLAIVSWFCLEGPGAEANLWLVAPEGTAGTAARPVGNSLEAATANPSGGGPGPQQRASLVGHPEAATARPVAAAKIYFQLICTHGSSAGM